MNKLCTTVLELLNTFPSLALFLPSNNKELEKAEYDFAFIMRQVSTDHLLDLWKNLIYIIEVYYVSAEFTYAKWLNRPKNLMIQELNHRNLYKECIDISDKMKLYAKLSNSDLL